MSYKLEPSEEVVTQVKRMDSRSYKPSEVVEKLQGVCTKFDDYMYVAIELRNYTRYCKIFRQGAVEMAEETSQINLIAEHLPTNKLWAEARMNLLQKAVPLIKKDPEILESVLRSFALIP